MRRLADELDADAVQEQVELLQIERAVAIIINVLDEVVDLRYGTSTTRARDATLSEDQQRESYGNGWRFGWSLIRCVSKVVN